MAERGVEVDHSTLHRWMLSYAPELDKRVRPHLSQTNDSWRVDETYIQVKGVWKYLYRAVDSLGNTLDFMLSAKRDGKAAARFFRKVLKADHTQTPRVIAPDRKLIAFANDKGLQEGFPTNLIAPDRKQFYFQFQ